MFVALDVEGNRVYADACEKGCICFCPACNEELRLRKGSRNKAHFAHKQDTECYYGRDQDYKTEWHIRMQEYFPREACEVRFVDNETGEIHIADVFLKSSNTVLEFQHSPISEQEFISRTAFHIKNGRRIIWLFDETSTSKENSFGRFRNEEDFFGRGIPSYKWMRKPRKFLNRGPDLKKAWSVYSICVYTGTEGDVFHRIVGQCDDFGYVVFSANPIQMTPGIDVKQFFGYDAYWMWQDMNAQYQAAARQRMMNQALPAYRKTNRRNFHF